MSYTSGLLAKTVQQVQQDDSGNIPLNTQLVCGQKGEEFLEYCTSIFSYCGYSTQIVIEEKGFGFLFYQSFCTQRKEVAVSSENCKRKCSTSTTTTP